MALKNLQGYSPARPNLFKTKIFNQILGERKVTKAAKEQAENRGEISESFP